MRWIIRTYKLLSLFFLKVQNIWASDQFTWFVKKECLALDDKSFISKKKHKSSNVFFLANLLACPSFSIYHLILINENSIKAYKWTDMKTQIQHIWLINSPSLTDTFVYGPLLYSLRTLGTKKIGVFWVPSPKKIGLVGLQNFFF